MIIKNWAVQLRHNNHSLFLVNFSLKTTTLKINVKHTLKRRLLIRELFFTIISSCSLNFESRFWPQASIHYVEYNTRKIVPRSLLYSLNINQIKYLLRLLPVGIFTLDVFVYLLVLRVDARWFLIYSFIVSIFFMRFFLRP